LGNGSSIRPAESHWYMVIGREGGNILPFVVGPWTEAGTAMWGEGAEILWIRFKIGVYFRHLPPSGFLNAEISLPDAGRDSFWLKGSAWQYPNFENVDIFVDRLRRTEALDYDPVVRETLNGHPPKVSPRTIRDHFLHVTGLSYSRIYQIERAQQAAALLQQETSIADVIHTLGYYDQPHLTRALKQWVGHTPAQLQKTHNPA